MSEAKVDAIRRIGREELVAMWDGLRQPYHDDYLALYSTVYGGVVTDPVLMMVPIDDHMVHRGDGIFETFKCVEGALYNLDGHLSRLERSTRDLAFTLPVTMEALRQIVLETIRIGGQQDCAVRMFVSRGPGSFGVNPYDCPAAQLYVAVTRLVKPFMTRNPEGAAVRTSTVPIKHPFFAGVKNCNYLNNVLMKKEAVDAKVDFVVAFDERGRLGEGATENIGVVTREGVLTFPCLDGILMGTTMVRVMELAEVVVAEGLLKEVRFGDLERQDIETAREIIIAGTTTDVTHVRTFDGKPIGNGTQGPVFKRLSELLLADIHSNPVMRTPVFR
ncbi:MAG: peptidase [Verrucomicrobia bacterium]|jgi:branched-subunit amino acid aminotransferase/4-amino-4-deoxychorismate lyase|nr:peptidase [Verrucomicrobiota bacterium]